MNHKEDDEQKALIQWVKFYKMPVAHDIERGAHLSDYLIAIPNGGKRNAREAARLKAQGVKAGVWDLFLPLARGGFHGLWIEMKAGKNKVTDLQQKWGDRMYHAGYEIVVCYSWEAAKVEITRYLKLD